RTAVQPGGGRGGGPERRGRPHRPRRRDRGFELLERELVALIARRLGEDPEAELPALLAGMCTTAVRLGTRRWAQAGSGTPGAAECVRHAFALVNHLVPPTA
ncbi:hypothetical protein AB8B12_24465, partial [Streptomyces sp. PGLac3x]